MKYDLNSSSNSSSKNYGKYIWEKTILELFGGLSENKIERIKKYWGSVDKPSNNGHFHTLGERSVIANLDDDSEFIKQSKIFGLI